jgi:hypothetical protein
MACCCGDWYHTECPSHPWAEPWFRKCSQLKRFGLMVRLTVHVSADNFIALNVDVLQHDVWLMPRQSNKWVKHISIGYVNELSPELLARLRHRWHFRITHLTFREVSNGGTGVIGSCELTKCPFFTRCKNLGHYRYAPAHISF